MMIADVLLVAFLVAVVALFLGRRSHVSTAESRLSDRDRRELEDLRRLVDDLRETAWDHRELDSALSVIIIDMIRSFERRERPEIP